MEVVDALNEHVAILPIEEAKEKIKSVVKYGGKSGSGSLPFTMSIDKMVLTNVLVPMKDNLSSNMLVSAWLVYYRVIGFNNQTVSGQSRLRKYTFAINAIDGSVIDLARLSR